MSSAHHSPAFRRRLLVWVSVLSVVVWGALLILCVLTERWLGVAVNGLLLVISWYNLRRAWRRGVTQRQAG
jgi:hypothetical protein